MPLKNYLLWGSVNLSRSANRLKFRVIPRSDSRMPAVTSMESRASRPLSCSTAAMPAAASTRTAKFTAAVPSAFHANLQLCSKILIASTGIWSKLFCTGCTSGTRISRVPDHVFCRPCRTPVLPPPIVPPVCTFLHIWLYGSCCTANWV